MTTTMPSMREVIEFFEARGLREKHTIMIGGGPVTEAFARKITADAYGQTAQDGVQLAIRFVNQMQAAGRG
jgi:methanogenic corrinoid protein MtbC1